MFGYCMRDPVLLLCPADLLLDCMELCKSTRAAMDVYQQCQIDDDYGFTAKVLGSTPRPLFAVLLLGLDDVMTLNVVAVRSVPPRPGKSGVFFFFSTRKVVGGVGDNVNFQR